MECKNIGRMEQRNIVNITQDSFDGTKGSRKSFIYPNPSTEKEKENKKKTQKNSKQMSNSQLLTKRLKTAQAPKTAPYHIPPPTQIS